jgi:type IX secretion system PorP/SprF family membrane protein
MFITSNNSLTLLFMKNTGFLIIFNLIGLIGFSQSNIRLNNYWENTYYINPASVYNEYKFVASVAGRKQWIGFPGAPDTEYFTFAAHINNKKNTSISQLGIQIFRDNIGYTQLINISPSYSHLVRFNDNRIRMSLGFAYKVQSLTYDMSRAHTQTPDDPSIYENETRLIAHNVDLGVELVNNLFVIGAASQNLLSLFIKENKLQTNSNFLYGMFKLNIDDYFHLLPGISAIYNENWVQMEFKMSVLMNSKNHIDFQLGVFYRTLNEFGILFSMDLNDSMRLACSYDYDVGGISRSSAGTPELMLIWKFGKIRGCQCSELYK